MFVQRARFTGYSVALLRDRLVTSLLYLYRTTGARLDRHVTESSSVRLLSPGYWQHLPSSKLDI